MQILQYKPSGPAESIVGRPEKMCVCSLFFPRGKLLRAGSSHEHQKEARKYGEGTQGITTVGTDSHFQRPKHEKNKDPFLAATPDIITCCLHFLDRASLYCFSHTCKFIHQVVPTVSKSSFFKTHPSPGNTGSS